MSKLCEFCGAYSPKTCEMEEDFGYCSWIVTGWEEEADPDRQRDNDADRVMLDKENGGETSCQE